MELKGRALFNLLKMSAKEKMAVDVQPWQIEDLSGLSMSDLFLRLKAFGIILDEPSFSLYIESSDSPEELAEWLCFDEMEALECDQVYLIVFELWKRLCKDKFCLSVFCDELDQWIEQYDQGALVDDEPLQKALSLLADVLDEAFDQGEDSRLLLDEISSYCAHDLEAFIIDYIADQVTKENTLYASELIEAFSAYTSHPKQFDLLKASVMALSDEEMADQIYRRVLEDVIETSDLDMALQFAEHLIHHGNLKLFLEVVQEACKHVKTEEEFQVLLTIISEYYRCLDRENEQKIVLQILDQRASIPLEASVHPNDPAMSIIKELVHRV